MLELGTQQAASRKKKQTKAEVTRRTIRLLREPQQGDREAFEASLKTGSEYIQRRGTRDEAMEIDDDFIDDDEDPEQAENTVRLPDGSNTLLTDEQRVFPGLGPIWSPDVQHTTLFFDLVDAAGVRGISSIVRLRSISWREQG